VSCVRHRPDLAATAVYRPLQWVVAARCGIAVPRSLVTNDPAAVQRFAAQSRTGVVVKPLTANLLYEDNTYKMGWTRKLSTDDLVDLRGVNATAHLVQDWVDKAYEVIDLPLSVEKALRAIMNELGLVYGAFDLSISNNDGSEVFWFLEINPGGQYGFLEGSTGIPVTDSLVRFLTGGVVT